MQQKVALRLDRKWTDDDLDELVRFNNELAKRDFWAYRQVVHPTMIRGWFQRETAAKLQRFYTDLAAGKRPVMVLQSPPQHGKSMQVVDLVGWIAGRDPNTKIIYGSFSSRLGVRANLWLQRTMDNRAYRNIFGRRINPDNVVTRSGMPLRNREILEWVHDDGSQGEGYFRNTTVLGQITGEGLDLGIIDDPIKGRAEANSQGIRDKTWGWLTDDFMSRFSERAGLLMIMCLTGDTQVTMADGSWKPLRDVRVGDKVTTWRNGKVAAGKVTAARLSGQDTVFRVRTEGSLIRGNKRHPFLVVRGDDVGWVKLADLRTGDMIVQSANICAGKRQDFSEDEAWALGFMFGDGWVTKNNKLNPGRDGIRYPTASWVTCIADCPQYPALAERAVEIWQQKFGCAFKLTHFGYWRVEKAALGRYLHAFGLGAGAKNKRIPPVMFQQTPALQRAFLDGFMDADGHRMVRGGCDVKRILLANRALIDDLRHMARSLGYRVTNVTENRRSLDAVVPPHSAGPKQWFSATFGYHWQAPRERAFTLSKVKSIRPCGREFVYDISVEGDANFIADGLVAHNTRWHVDDPCGRMLEHFPQMEVARYKAIATEDEEHLDEDGEPLIRQRGEPLFPELKSLEFLMKQKEPMTQAGWESIYQQSPIVAGGGLFPVEKFGLPLPERPTMDKIKKSVRYWDKAGTMGDGAYTAGVRIDWLKEGGFVVSDVVRGQWGFHERETRIKQIALSDNMDGWRTDIWVEQEPGSGGKESAERTVQMLAGFNVHRDRVKGNKELRAEPYAAQVQAGNVQLVTGRWNRDFLDEHETFPNGKYKDQVDAAGGAFARLTVKRYEAPVTVALPVYGNDE